MRSIQSQPIDIGNLLEITDASGRDRWIASQVSLGAEAPDSFKNLLFDRGYGIIAGGGNEAPTPLKMITFKPYKISQQRSKYASTH